MAPVARVVAVVRPVAARAVPVVVMKPVAAAVALQEQVQAVDGPATAVAQLRPVAVSTAELFA